VLKLRRRASRLVAASIPWNEMTGEELSRMQLKLRLAPVLARGGTIPVGPWMSELGFEVLYWIPFLRWLTGRFELDRERLVAVSRGGVAEWYSDICDGYVDIFAAISADEFRERIHERWAETGGQKQMFLSRWDAEVLRSAGEALSWRGEAVLHPSLMYHLFRRFWKGADSVHHVEHHVRFAPLAAPDPEQFGLHLPERFVAVKFYFRPSFPDTVENRLFVQRAVDTLAEETDVVLLDTGIGVDDHVESQLETSGRVSRPLDGVATEQNLAAQAAIIARADGFFGTYGGLSYVPIFYRVPSVAFYSEPRHFLPSHLDVARRAGSAIGASFTALDTRRLEPLAVLDTRNTA